MGAIWLRVVVVILISVLVLEKAKWSDCCWDQEHTALVNLQSFFDYNWIESGSDCCEWKWVECNVTTRRVTGIILSGLRRYHYIPQNRYHLFNASIFLPFQDLRILDLAYVGLVGSVENEGFEKLSKLRHLQALSLSYNSLNGSILSSLSEISTLESLNLGGNDLFTGSNRTNDFKLLSRLNCLEFLDLSRTKMTNNFLLYLGGFSSLRTLLLQENNLEGTVHLQGWCHLKRLEELSLRGNGLGGEIPSCWGNLTSLRYLDISGNHFTGNVASTPLTNLSMLQLLAFSSNQFQVPPSFYSFANHSNLKVLLADHNKLAAEPATSKTWSPKFQLKVFDMSNYLDESNCVIDEHGVPQLPNFLYHQSDLRYIDLSHCSYGGIKFPHWLVENNTRLEDLLFAKTSIDGPLLLPSHPIPNLKTLDISSNNLQHEIPRNFCSVFPNLETLYIFGNALKSNIPVCWGGMKWLQILDLESNNFFGEIPRELAMSSSLVVLNLGNNKLSGRISPEVYYLFNSLEAVLLGGNMFEGEIPDFSTISSSKLRYFDLSYNHFTGKIPNWLWKNTYLVILDLSSNHFEGSIPMGLCNLVYLGFLDLSENHLSGTLPSCSNLQRVMYVHLRKNKLSGKLSPVFNGSSSLVTLDLSENNLTGKIPDWVGSLQVLSILLLKANQFDGELPVHLCRLYNLSILDLSQNKLSGHMPSCLSHLTFKSRVNKSHSYPIYTNINIFPEYGTVLEDMRLTLSADQQVLPHADFYIHRYEREEIEFSTKKQRYTYTGECLNLLSVVDLSCNQLTGIIPPGLGNLSEIRGLNLSHNNFTGPIPSSFSELKLTESLDLSYNNLNGRVPPQLAEMTFLEVFSVAHNNLSGPLPDRKAQFGTFDESSYEGNPLLCGLPLNKRCNEEGGSPAIPSSEEEQGGLVDMAYFYVSFAVSYAILFLTTVVVLYINPYWRRVCINFVEDQSIACYYFIIDSIRRLPCFRRNI